MSAGGARLGVTLPFEGIGLREHGPLLARLEAAGYTDAWSGEVDGADGFTPLAVAAMATESMRLGTGIVSAFTRGPGVLAMTASSLAELAPGRFCLGIGAGSDVIVERWNAGEFDRPLSKVRDVAGIVGEALGGAKTTVDAPTTSVAGLRLSRPVTGERVPIFLAALRPRMLRLAGERADGVLLNWLGARDVPKAVAEVRRGEERAGAARTEVACRVFVCPGDPQAAETAARRSIAAYMTVPVYAAFQEWLGRGDALAAMNAHWAAGERREAMAAIPASAVRELIILGAPVDWREHIRAYRDHGVDTVIVHVLPSATEPEARSTQVLDTVRALAPNAA